MAKKSSSCISPSPLGSSALTAGRRRGARSPEYRAEAAHLAPYEQLARLVIEHRIRESLSQSQLAVRLGTSVSAISRLESGRHRPNMETLERLGRAFGGNLVIGFESKDGERRELVALG